MLTMLTVVEKISLSYYFILRLAWKSRVVIVLQYKEARDQTSKATCQAKLYVSYRETTRELQTFFLRATIEYGKLNTKVVTPLQFRDSHRGQDVRLSARCSAF
jgi:hypothetical protein